MDTKSLLDVLESAFEAERSNGLVINRFGLAPAYRGLVDHQYVLGVCIPSSNSLTSCNDKADEVIDVLFDRLTPDQRKPIDRVRVYSSELEYDLHAQRNFDESYGFYCNEVSLQRTQTRAVVA